MMLSPIQYGLGAGSGVVVGFLLGLVGGGGSLLATPLMVYAVGVRNLHLAIGTSALAVAASALANLVARARSGHVRWACAAIFSAFGLVGVLAGSTLGKQMDGRHLLVLFALLMLAVAIVMLLRKRTHAAAPVDLSVTTGCRLAAAGGLAGGLAGFFGIGGGFLIVPALMWATGMPILEAVGSSLTAVTVFGLGTAINYALSGWVDWPLAAVFLCGGVVGGAFGARTADVLNERSGELSALFSTLLIAAALYVLYRSF